ncbi:MAG: N-6 DNA methylase [Saprospiraceae bacterium]
MSATAAEIKATGATFTPQGMGVLVAERIAQACDFDGSELKVLDPSCGDGILLDSMKSVLDSRNELFSLTGYDINPTYLNTAKEVVSDYRATFLQDDFLGFDFDEVSFDADIVIANPPYVRTQVLGADYAQKIAKQFGLKGRVDLYHAFLIQMTNALKEGGILGVITSNRFISTKAGASVRKFLQENYDILEVLDLGDTDLFDAAVLPAITIARKKTNSDDEEAQFIRVYKSKEQSDHEVDSVYNLFDSIVDGVYEADGITYSRNSGQLRFLRDKEASWTMLTNEELKWVTKLESNAPTRVKDHFKVRVGIKSTADDVFLNTKEPERFKGLEQDIIYDLISGHNISPWSLDTTKQLQVLYPYDLSQDKRVALDIEDYPKAYKFLLEFKERLESRSYLINGGRQWFELWVPQRPSHWELPKLVFPDISPEPKFFYDDEGRIVNGNCYWIAAFNKDEEEILTLLQGVANSKVMVKYHDLMYPNKLYAGRRRYMSQYVENYPLPDIDHPSSQTVVKLVRKARNKPTEKLLLQIEEAVATAFGFAPK